MKSLRPLQVRLLRTAHSIQPRGVSGCRIPADQPHMTTTIYRRCSGPTTTRLQRERISPLLNLYHHSRISVFQTGNPNFCHFSLHFHVLVACLKSALKRGHCLMIKLYKLKVAGCYLSSSICCCAKEESGNSLSFSCI